MSNLLNVNYELSKLKHHGDRVNFCTGLLSKIKDEYDAKQNNNQLMITMVLISAYSLFMVYMGITNNYFFSSFTLYILLTVVATLIVFMIRSNFPTSYMKNVGTLGMITTALVSITPVLPYFTGYGADYDPYIRLIGLVVLILVWVFVLTGDRGRNKRLKAIWDSLKED